MYKRDFSGLAAGVSMLGFGGMRLPEKGGAIDYDRAKEMVDYAIARGVNYFDTAYFYHGGESESFFGRAMSGYARGSYYLADKMPVWMLKREGDFERILEEQKRRCNTDYFDFYLIHAIGDGNYSTMKKFNVYGKLSKLKEEGVIKRLGFSFHGSLPLYRELVDGYKWDFTQLQINYFDWAVNDADKLYAMASEKNIPIAIMEPVRGGMLANLPASCESIFKETAADRTPASWAVRFVASLEGVYTVLSGMSDITHVKDNIATFSDFEPLTKVERAVIDRVLAEYLNQSRIPCTACNYCSDCPQGINIPALFAMYNETGGTGNMDRFREEYGKLEKAKNASACISCGHCESVCPQSIEITAHMANLSKKASE